MHINSVLIVDADKNNCAVSEMTLDSEFDVYVAQPGSDCLLVAECEQPDLILLDVKMPGTDGQATLIKLRANRLTAGIPVILMSPAECRTDELFRRRYQKLDIIGFIQKPFARQELAAQIRKLAAAR